MMKESPQNRDEMTGGLSGSPRGGGGGDEGPHDDETGQPSARRPGQDDDSLADERGEAGEAEDEESAEPDPDDDAATAQAGDASEGAPPAGPLAGLFPSAAAMPTLGGARMPQRLTALRIVNGRAVGLDLPALDDREVLAAWRKAIPRGALYVRIDDRRKPLSIEHVQRLARLGELWVDGALADGDTALDLLVAGAHRLVVWPDHSEESAQLLDALGDAAAVGWDGNPAMWTRCVELATALAAPLVCAVAPPLPAEGLHVYRIDLASHMPTTMQRIQQPLPPAVPAGIAPVPGQGLDDDAAGDDADDTGETDDDAEGEDNGGGDDTRRPARADGG